MIDLKIGRHVYTITENDEFMDNGASVYLVSQSEEKTSWGYRPYPVLSKRAIKEIGKFERVPTIDNYNYKAECFTLKESL